MDIIELEKKGCFDYFWEEISTSSKCFGLIRDNSKDDDNMKRTSSIASTGFGLSALCIGVENGFVSYEQAEQRCLATLSTMWDKLPHRHGFFYHFMDMEDGSPRWNQEVSIIDTSIALMGALSAGEYFGGEVKRLANVIYERVEWPFYLNKEDNTFYMGYDEKGGFGSWSMYAEQLMVYFLACASPTFPVNTCVYDAFTRDIGSYKGKEFIYTPIGSIFPYQYSHAFLDFRNKVDTHGVNWFQNSIEATLSNRIFCIDQSVYYKTFHKNAWGVSACQCKEGYDGGQGALPANAYHVDGTIPPCGSIGSIVFTPQYSIDAITYFYEHQKPLWGKYGLHDAYNLTGKVPWYCDFEIGIDKGITLLMLENYQNNFIWNLMNKNEHMIKAFQRLKFTTL